MNALHRWRKNCSGAFFRISASLYRERLELYFRVFQKHPQDDNVRYLFFLAIIAMPSTVAGSYEVTSPCIDAEEMRKRCRLKSRRQMFEWMTAFHGLGVDWTETRTFSSK